MLPTKLDSESAWFDTITTRIDHETGLEIPPDIWRKYEWYDVTTMGGYRPGVHVYVKMRELRQTLDLTVRCPHDTDGDGHCGSRHCLICGRG